MARALVLRHHLEDSPGLIGEALVARGFDLDVRLLNEVTPTPSLEDHALLVILGSKCAVYDHEVEAAWFGRELDLMAAADRAGVAILGICFGAQALCRLFGGEVTRAPEGEVGWFDVEVAEGVALSRGPWFEFHFDLCALPEGARVWATSPRAVQAFALGRHVGVQFHPEIDEAQLAEWLNADPEDAREMGLDVQALLAQTARETPAARRRAQDLVDLVLAHAGLA
ncbi:MAG: type 1 glutamine amidotransferase [Acidimicrobiales bacterium]